MDLAGLLQLPPQGLVVFLLVLIRASSIFLIAPVLGNANVPMQVKVGLAFLLAVILTPLIMHTPLKFNYQDPWMLSLAVLQEIAVGVLIGFLAQLLFVAIQFAGQVIGLQMGFGIASVFDPSTHAQVAITAQLYLFLGVLVFLLMDGHHWLIIALQRSFTAVPLGTFTVDGRTLAVLLTASNDMFWTAVMLMAPVMGVLVLGEVSMSIIARIMPQMNMFVAAFPVKILLGIITMALSFPLLIGYLNSETEHTFATIFQYLH